MSDDIIIAAPEVICCGCNKEFHVYFTESYFADGVLGCWVECPHCKGRYVLTYKHHESRRLVHVSPLAASFQPHDSTVGSSGGSTLGSHSPHSSNPSL